MCIRAYWTAINNYEYVRVRDKLLNDSDKKIYHKKYSNATQNLNEILSFSFITEPNRIKIYITTLRRYTNIIEMDFDLLPMFALQRNLKNFGLWLIALQILLQITPNTIQHIVVAKYITYKNNRNWYRFTSITEAELIFTLNGNSLITAEYFKPIFQYTLGLYRKM